MRRFLIQAVTGLAVMAVAAVATYAQDTGKTDFEQKYEAKVAEAWFTDNGFTDDYDKARELATASGKPIFTYFTRSYAP